MMLDRNGAAIRPGDPVKQQYAHRARAGREPMRGVATRVWEEGSQWVVEYREDGTEHTRNGTSDTVEYDWHPPDRDS